jgi:hypothetical protein
VVATRRFYTVERRKSHAILVRNFVLSSKHSMLDLQPRISPTVLLVCVMGMTVLASCKRSEPPPDLLKTQRDAMDRAKEVGKTMQKGVDAEGKKADEEGK